MAERDSGIRCAVSWAAVVSLAGIVMLGSAAPIAAQRQMEIRRSTTAVSCQVITGDELRDAPSVARGLQGRVTGLELSYSSGQPGAGTRINVRGVNSLRNTPPLVFMDGLLIREVEGGGQTITLLDQLNPNDILLIEVFRGPAATTLYGTGAAGGVIRIYTKHGNPSAELLSDERARCVP
jgi:outer membrane cobalamin receptor